MKSDATRYFVCPKCCGDLAINPQESSFEIVSGALSCTACSVTYLIVRGVPRFVPDEQYTDIFGRQWKRCSLPQHDSRNGTSIFRDRLHR